MRQLHDQRLGEARGEEGVRLGRRRERACARMMRVRSHAGVGVGGARAVRRLGTRRLGQRQPEAVAHARRQRRHLRVRFSSVKPKDQMKNLSY